MRNDLTILEQGEHLARRQELIGFKRGDNRFTINKSGDRKSDEFQKATVALRSTKEIAKDIDRGEIISPLKSTNEIAKSNGSTVLPLKTTAEIAHNIWHEGRN